MMALSLKQLGVREDPFVGVLIIEPYYLSSILGAPEFWKLSYRVGFKRLLGLVQGVLPMAHVTSSRLQQWTPPFLCSV